MGDIINFHDKKIDDDELLDGIFEKEAENSGNIDAGAAGSEKMEAEKDNVVSLHTKSWPEIDWEDVESIRRAEYARVPKKAVAVIRKMFENPSDDAYFEIDDFEGGDYPPDPISIKPVLGDAVWIIDLLHRYGGGVHCGDQQCVVKRKRKQPALLLVQPISRSTREALINVMGVEFEHFLQSKSWVIWGKEITDKMMVMIITNRLDEDRIYLGIFDRKTAWVFMRRMENISISRVLGL